jgi:predicted O-methyltransferase YrrM
MSEISTPVSADHFHYVANHTVQDDTLLRDLKNEARSEGIPPIWIAPEQGSFMQLLLKMVRASEVIEIGTLAGYSAIWMARALPATGRLRTIEASKKHADFAERWIARSDVAEQVSVLRGRGAGILPGLASDSADAAFIDADKEGYPLYLRECLRIVRRGGIIMADNAFGFGRLFDTRDQAAAAIRSFNEIIAKEKSLQGIIVPIGDGLWIAMKM